MTGQPADLSMGPTPGEAQRSAADAAQAKQEEDDMQAAMQVISCSHACIQGCLMPSFDACAAQGLLDTWTMPTAHSTCTTASAAPPHLQCPWVCLLKQLLGERPLTPHSPAGPASSVILTQPFVDVGVVTKWRYTTIALSLENSEPCGI